MNSMRRALGRSWVGLLLLCGGGCSLHPLMDSSLQGPNAGQATPLMPPASPIPWAVPANLTPADTGPSAPAVPPPNRGVSLTDALAYRESLQKSGLSYAEADEKAKSALLAWHDIAMAAAGTKSDFTAGASDASDAEGIALNPAEDSEWTQSPANKSSAGALASATSRSPKPPRTQFPLSPTAARKRNSSPDVRRQIDLVNYESGRTRPRAEMKIDARDSRAVPKAQDDLPETYDPNSWLVPLQEATEQLYAQLDDPDLPTDLRSKYEVMLSLLLLAEEDPEQAVSTLENLDDEELEFWRQTVLGLGTLLDTQSIPRRQDRVERAADFLNQGVRSLATLGRLQVRNLALCTKINGYGDFQECRPTDIKPDAPLLLYVEVENYLAEPLTSGRSQTNWIADSKRRDETASGATKYATEFHGHYEIYDANQNRIVPEKQLPIARDECRNVRRDYFIPYQIYLPKQLPPGAYRLDLTIEDKKSDKVGNAVLDFEVR